MGIHCQEGLTLKSATTVKTASDAVLTGYERPSDQGDAVKEKRAGYGQTYFDKYAGTKTEKPAGTCTAAKVIAVAVDQIGYKEKASNTSLDSKTANAYEVIVDEVLIVDEHIVVVRRFAFCPDDAVILFYGMGNRRFTCSVVAIEEVDKRELINRDIREGRSIQFDICYC